MTLQEKQIEVLKWMGWTNIHYGYSHPDFANNNRNMKEWVGINPINKDYPPAIALWPIPKITLDWVHECIGKLEPKYWAKFLRELVIATKTEQENNSITAVMLQTNATAEQRLKALYEVITTSEGFALHSAATQRS